MMNRIYHSALYNVEMWNQLFSLSMIFAALLGMASIAGVGFGVAAIFIDATYSVLIASGMMIGCTVALALISWLTSLMEEISARKSTAWSNLESVDAVQGADCWDVQALGDKVMLCVSVISGTRQDMVYQWTADVRYGKRGYIKITAPRLFTVNGGKAPADVRRNTGYLLDGWVVAPDDFVDACDQAANICNRATQATESLIAEDVLSADAKRQKANEDNVRKQARESLFRNVLNA